MFYESFLKAIDKGWVYVVAFIVFAFFTYIPKIIKYLEVKKKKKIGYLNKALKCEFVTGLTRMYLQEELATEHFRLCTNMNVEKKRRENIIRFYNNYKGELSFVDFKRALPHLIIKNQKIEIKITMLDGFFYACNYIVGVLSILIFIGIMFYIKPLIGSNLEGFFILFSVGVFLMLFGVSLFWQNLPMVSAMKIRRLTV